MYVGKDRRSGSLTAEDAGGRRGGHDKAWPSTAQTAARASWRDALRRVRVPCSCGCWHEHVFPVGGRDMLTQTAA